MGTISSVSRVSSAVTSAAGPDAVRHDDARMSNSRAPSGSAGGALNGTYPSPGLVKAPWAPTVLTDAATIAVDASLGNHFRVTLAGNRTLANPTNPTDGQRITVEVIQDATGTRTLAYGTAYAFGADIASIKLTTTADKRDFIGFIYNSTAAKWYCIAVTRGY